MATSESQLASLLAAATALRAQLAAIDAELAQLGLSTSAVSRAELETQRDQIRRELADINAQIQTIQATVFGRTSAGQIIAGEAEAKSQNAVEVSPVDSPYALFKNGRIQPPPDTQSGSNAEKFSLNLNTGVNGELRPFVQTQSTPIGPVNTGLGLKYRVPNTATVNEDRVSGGNFRGDYSLTPQPSGEPGVGGRDDSGSRSGGSATVTALNAIDYTSVIVPQPNVLTQYASYTYQASLYLCTKQQYQAMINSGQKTISGAQLLMQSGGSSIADGVRNANFDLDFYIDSIEMKSFFAGKAVRLAHNVKEVKMTVIEPNGITLLNRLKLAVDEFAPSLGAVATTNTTNTTKPPGAKPKNFTAQIYLLAIRFYGYDEQGNLVRAGTNQTGQTADPNAFVEKWYPLIMTKFNFKVASKLTEYDLEFKAPPYYIGASAQRATIPFNIELSGGTVKDILAGPTVYAEGQNSVNAGAPAGPATQASVRAIDNAIAAGGTAAAPAKANAATSAKKTVRQGIMQALNEYQLKLVQEGIYQFPDEYNIEFALDEMASATITNPGGKSVAKGNTSMAVPASAADAKLGAKQSMDPNSRVQGATAGMQLVQFIDTLLRNSSYIRDQQRVIIDENSGKEQATGVETKNMSWYKIGFRAEAKFDQYDLKRQDYAYKITYVISPFKLVSMDSPYFTQPKFNGVHKSYKYWFTGENTEVLSYEEQLNSLYYVVMSGSNLGNVSSSVDSEQKFSYQTASAQASQGADGKTLEPAANAADQLYNPADLKSCKVTIVGDPAWLQQGEAFVGLKKGQPDYFQAFLADGTINFDSQQILFEISYNTAGDYNSYTGLLDVTKPVVKPSNTNTDANTLKPQEQTTQISRVYIAKQCISEFKKGKFTQTLEGTLKLFKPDQPVPVRETKQTDKQTKTATNQGAKTQISAPGWSTPTSVTGQTPTSAVAKGVEQLLRPPSQLNEPSLAQLQASPVYIQARRGGATPAAALDAARAAFAAGTNNYSGTAVPGIRDTSGTLQSVVKDGNPG